MSYKGKFKPKNPSKYKGDPTTIIYRSRWELKLMNYLDNNPEIISWSSEELTIPYVSPLDNRIHRYYPDFVVKKKVDGTEKTETLVIEVKPFKETMEPKKQDKLSKSYLYEVKTWGINSSKWKSAKEFCEDRKWKFVILTENELGIKF
jgi:hypothetical protein